MEIEVIRTEGLGDSTYVLIHEGQAIVVDPQRDIDRFEAVLDRFEADLLFVFETHLHNDYISGGRDLVRALGGEHVMPSGAAPAFRCRPAFHMEDLEAGSMSIRPIHTPGHTPEHMSYLVLEDGKPVTLFSGGSLLVGSAGRSDLLGMERADTLARLQYGTVHRLADLPDPVGLYPTHGSGSFCTTSQASSHTSTIGAEKVSNPVLAYADEDSFVEGQLSGLVPYPAYYRHMGPSNIAGVDPPGRFDVEEIDEASYATLETEVHVVDARPKSEYAAGHLAGSLAIELRDDFAIWVGWILPFNSPLVLVLNPTQVLEEPLRQLARIGFDEVRGVIRDLDSWNLPLESFPATITEEFADAIVAGAQVLDVRAPNEWEHGVIHDSALRYVPDIVTDVPADLDKDQPVWVACGTGYRANLAASLLEARGYRPIVLTNAGVTDVLSNLSKKGKDQQTR
ncbi:MAG: rhodanese-like domain-containing protein [Acidimicrobiia bacterium]